MARQGSRNTGAGRTRFSRRERNTGNPGGVSRNPRELWTGQGSSHERTWAQELEIKIQFEKDKVETEPWLVIAFKEGKVERNPQGRGVKGDEVARGRLPRRGESSPRDPGNQQENGTMKGPSAVQSARKGN